MFQSTLPMRGATAYHGQGDVRLAGFQSTLPMRGATEWNNAHATAAMFQSTLPMRGATGQLRTLKQAQY